MISSADLQLYFIMGSPNTSKEPADVLRQAIAGGITIFQFREKGSNAKTGPEKLRLGMQLRQICKESHIPFIVNDEIDLALELEADGVHIGQQDESVTAVKRKIPDHMSVGVSVSRPWEAVIAERQGADYLGAGPIFQTKTKENALSPIGVEGLQDIVKRTSLPVVAIGGVKKDHIDEILYTGAAGASVISAITCAEDCEQAARKLREAERLQRFMSARGD